MKSSHLRLRGFTLIELIIAITILGVLAALISGNFFTSLRKGRDAKRKVDLEQMQRALEMYYEDKRAYPTAAAAPGFPFGSQFCETDACAASEKIYMQRVPNDPVSGTDYEYQSDGTLYSLYACLENNLQILPYESQNYMLSCTTNCKNQAGSDVACVWGISSPNTTP